MPNFRLPLSGDVTQAINPWNWMLKSVGSQFGPININLGKSAEGAAFGNASKALNISSKHRTP